MSILTLVVLVTTGCWLFPSEREREPASDPQASPAPPPAPAPEAASPAPELASDGAPSAAAQGFFRTFSAAAFDALTSGVVPQAPELVALYRDSSAERGGPIERGMLVCRANVWGAFDGPLAGGADVAMSLRLSGGAIRRTGQSPLRTYSFPVARLDPGELIWVQLIDLDVMFHDTIGEGSTPYERAPMTFSMPQAELECRIVDPELVRRRADAAIGVIARSIERLDGVEPDLTAPDFGYPREHARQVLTAASEALRWVEATDEAYRAEVARAMAFDREWGARAAAAVDAAPEELPEPGTAAELGPGRQVRVRQLACGPEAAALVSDIDASVETPDDCVVVLGLDSSRRTSLPPIAEMEWDMWAIDGAAEVLPARPLALRRDDAWLPTAERTRLDARTSIDVVLALPAGASATLLRLSDGAAPPVVLRLR